MNKTEYPRIMIAGTESGCGKTSITTALVAALRNHGMRVQTFKTGPDYLDPTYLTRVSGRPCYNLDAWMMGKDYVRNLFARVASDADISIIEGAMGLFDGILPDSPKGSSAEIARWLETPILLIANAQGMARSFAAVVKGFDHFEGGTRIAGALANRCGSARHVNLLRDSLNSVNAPPLLGGFVKEAFPQLSSRHLGLVPAGESNLPDSSLQEFFKVAEAQLNIQELIDMAHSAPPLIAKPNAHIPATDPIQLAVAFDEAFHFYYQDFFDALTAQGCCLTRFSPLHDQAVPQTAQAVYLGGGYPEVHAHTLSDNHAMLASINTFAESGRPLYAECGGLMYLTQGIELIDGTRHPMAGLLPVWSIMNPRLRTLGYVEVTCAKTTFLAESGKTIRGHEFHYSRLNESPVGKEGWDAAYALRDNRSNAANIPEGYSKGNVLASYVHLHLASHPEAITHFLKTIRDHS